MKRLLVSVHDVTPAKFDLLRRIDAFLADRGVGAHYAMLVVPDYWHGWPLDAHPEFGAWLRERAAAGVEMILHGYYHQDDSRHQSAAASFKAAHMTAGEGEFLGLSRQDANERIARGRQMVEAALGSRLQGFIAPAWLYGEGAMAALADHDFAFAEDHWRVWSPRSGRNLARGPVISYASRSRARIASSLLWSRIATTLLRPLPAVRLAIHPNDFTVPSLIAETTRALDRFLTERKPGLYKELL